MSGFRWDSLGDFDGDGVEDLIVGAPYEEDRINDVYGAIYLFFMNSDGTVKDFQKIANGSGGLPIRTTVIDGKFGFSVQNMGDLDGNGVVDIAVGAPEMSGNGCIGIVPIRLGRFFILLMNADGTGSEL